jgi:uncharacterized protein YlxP (DUF503 family)
MDEPGLKPMPIGLLTLYLNIPGCTSLKEKRSRLKPFIARLHREFNISVAEIDRLDAWQETVVACALVSNNSGYTQRTLQQIVHWVETSWPDLSLFDDQIEII